MSAAQSLKAFEQSIWAPSRSLGDTLLNETVDLVAQALDVGVDDRLGPIEIRDLLHDCLLDHNVLAASTIDFAMVTSAAGDVGYSDVSAFIMVFKEVFGETPAILQNDLKGLAAKFQGSEVGGIQPAQGRTYW